MGTEDFLDRPSSIEPSFELLQILLLGDSSQEEIPEAFAEGFDLEIDPSSVVWQPKRPVHSREKLTDERIADIQCDKTVWIRGRGEFHLFLKRARP